MGAPRSLHARREGPTYYGGWGAPRLLQPDGTALGQSTLPLGRAGGDGLRLVDRSRAGGADHFGLPTPGPLPRLLCLLGSTQRGEDRRGWPLGTRSRRELVPGDFP